MYSSLIKSSINTAFIKKYPLIFKKYRPLKHLSKGAFSNIYLGINKITKEKVAIKIEERNKIDKYLETECFFLFSLKGHGIPKVISFGHNKDYDILVMPLLGKSLHEIQLSKNYNFEFKDICLLAIQIIERIQWVHSQKIIHRDIKPDNFLIGLNDPNIIYLIDFGLSKKYRSSTTGNHIKYTKIRNFTGSLRYASYNALKLREQSRRDDLESIGYMLIYLIKGRLPWDNIRVENKRSSYFKLSLYKKNIEPEILCSNLPKEFSDYIRYVKNLNFEDDPDYNYLKSLFQIMLKKQGIEENKIFFSWINEKNINQIKKSINLSKRMSSSRGRILNKIKRNIEFKRSISEIHNGITNSENFGEGEDNKLSCNLKKNKLKKKLEEISENAKPNNIKLINFDNKPVINNYIYSYISPGNNININNSPDQNKYQFKFTGYNPFIVTNNDNNTDKEQNLNLNFINDQNDLNPNNFDINYTPVITYNNINKNYQTNNIIGKYQDRVNNNIKNIFQSQNYNNNHNQNKTLYKTNNQLNTSYNISKNITKNNYYPQNIHYNKVNNVPLSYNNDQTNIQAKNQGISRFKNFNLWNISPFKKRNNYTQMKQKSKNLIRVDNINNIKSSVLMDDIKRFNNQYNIVLDKNMKNLMKNKIKNIKNQQLMQTNLSADSNKIKHIKKKYNYHGNNDDKNCSIF